MWLRDKFPSKIQSELAPVEQFKIFLDDTKNSWKLSWNLSKNSRALAA